MEQKILDTLVQVQDQITGMQSQINGIQNQIGEMKEQIDKKIDDVKEELRDEIKQESKKLNRKINDVREEILDQHFLFEQEYGIKIDAIFDAVTLELDKNLEKSEKLHRLEKRMDRNEVTIFGHEKRISTLELKR